jgi:hypothetical protein
MDLLTVELPGGLVDDGGGRLTAAALRPLSGREEEWLAAHRGGPSAPAVTRLLGACLLGPGGAPAGAEFARRLLVGDRDFLMLQLRRLNLGEEVRAVATCPACEARMDLSFSVGDVPVDRRPQTATAYALELDGRSVRFRLPNGGDQEALLDRDGVDPDEYLLARCLRDDGGKPLTPGERAAVAGEMDRVAPQVDLELDLTCPECGHAFSLAFDTTAFVLDEMRLDPNRLLREVHLLAFYYHWSESEILGLRRDRRRAYLALLRDTLQP